MDEIVALFIPITAILGSFTFVAIVVYFRYKAQALRHGERMAAIEKGIELPPEPQIGPRAYQLRGLIWLVVGVGMSIFFLATFAADHDRDMLAVATLGLIPMGVGIAYLVVYRAESRASGSRERTGV